MIFAVHNMRARYPLPLSIFISLSILVLNGTKFPAPPEVWKDYDPDQGDFKEEIVRQETKDGILRKESYFSA